MIIVYTGRRGAGKTLTMIKDSYLFYKNDFTIYSNMTGVSFANYLSSEDILNIDSMSDFFDCVILIDELQIFFDSRRSMNKKNIDFSYFVQQIRKRNIHLLATTQFSGTIDKRVRQHTDIQAMPKFMPEFNLCEVEYIDLTSIEDITNMGLYSRGRVVFNAEQIFKLYNTNEVILR